MSDVTRHNFGPEGTGSTAFSRRQVIKAGAWAAPVVAVAVAAPGAAATTTPPAPNGTIEVTAVTVTGTGPWTISVTVKNNATNAAAAAVGSVILTATNGTFNAGATSAGFSLAPGAQTTLTGFVTLARATTTAAAVSVAANPSATGYSPVGKTATVAPALGNVAVTINGSGSTFSVSATNAAGNPPATVVVPLSEVHGGSAVSITWTPNASGLNWSWDNATRTATLTVPAGPAVATGTLLTANGLGGNNKYATVSPGGAVSFVGQVFPSTGPTAVTLGRP